MAFDSKNMNYIFNVEYFKDIFAPCNGKDVFVENASELIEARNQDIFDFEISAEDMSVLTHMPQNTWLGEHPDFAIPKKKSNLNQ